MIDPVQIKANVDLEAKAKDIVPLCTAIVKAIGTGVARCFSTVEPALQAGVDHVANTVRRRDELAETRHELAMSIERVKGENVLAIVARAAELGLTPKEIEKTDPSWLLECMNASSTAVNEDLREIFARLLAEPYTNNRTCGKRTLSIVRTMESTHANAFARLARCTWHHDDVAFIVWMNVPANLRSIGEFDYNSLDVSFPELADLQWLGIIHDMYSHMSIQILDTEQYRIGDRTYRFKIHPQSRYQGSLPSIVLTPAGEDLMRVIDVPIVSSHLETILESCCNWGVDPVEVDNPRAS
ncbi:MAG: DUF2806 domain-containing protein [Phycisphaerales bacterium]